MITLDTSSLIRYFTNDIPSRAQQVKTLIEGEEKIQIPDVVFPELEYVLLGATYSSSRIKVLKAFNFLSSRRNISISKVVRSAISIYGETKLDIADCIIAVSSLENKLASFDKGLLKVEGVKPLFPSK